MLDRPTAAHDPVHDVVRLLRLETARPAQLNAAGDWGVEFDAYPHAKFAAVIDGTCWISTAAVPEPVKLVTGDAYLLADGQPYQLGSSATEPGVPSGPLFAAAVDGVAHAGSATASEVIVIGGSLRFASGQAHLLLDALPPLMILRGDSAGSGAEARAVRSIVQMLGEEARHPGLGSTLIMERLADLLLIQALRAVAARGASHGQTGWLAALADPEIGRALHLIHDDPAHRWTVAGLGGEVGLSRSTFAQRFRRLVGQPPLDYLLQWRMSTAAEILTRGDRTVSAVAAEAGYTSDSAFSAAFKRVMGTPPGHYRFPSRTPAR
jgi:AraC-like DNA-binding protein